MEVLSAKSDSSENLFYCEEATQSRSGLALEDTSFTLPTSRRLTRAIPKGLQVAGDGKFQTLHPLTCAFRLNIIAVLLLGFFGLNISAPAQNVSPEYKLKAVFLFNFVQYVDFPTNAFASEESPLVIGILGNDPFGKFLDDTVRDEVVKQRKLQVRRYKNVSEIKECHVLYIGTSEAANLKSILAALKGRSILTVSGIEDFATRHGGMIHFFTDKTKIRFRINPAAAKAVDLTISSKLLQLAEIVR